MRAITILGGGIRKVELIHHPEEGMDAWSLGDRARETW